MRTRISKTFDFDAAHRLPNVPADHKCGRMHGHTYRVEVILEGTPTEPSGWFIDYALIAQAWKPLHDALDHRTLNEIEGLENPTTENLCAWVLRKLLLSPAFPYSFLAPFITAIRIYESSTTWCEVTRDGR